MCIKVRDMVAPIRSYIVSTDCQTTHPTTYTGEPNDPIRGTDETMGTGVGGTLTRQGIPETSTSTPSTSPGETTSTVTKVAESMSNVIKDTAESVKDSMPTIR